MKTKAELLNERAMHLKAARDIVAAAEKAGRDFTEDERREVQAALGAAQKLNADIRALEGGNDDIRAQLQALAGGSGPTNQRSHFSGGVWGEQFLKALERRTGRKDLLPNSGSVTVGQLSDTIGTLADDGRAQTLLQFIPTEDTTADTIAYLREVVRAHAARPVAVGERKPQANYVLERQDDRIRTIAHLSPPVSRNWLSDGPTLQGYIGNTLRDGVLLELEYQILQGSGAGEDLTGILSTAGVLVQPFAGDILVTTRKAITLLESRPVVPSGWVFRPDDWETVELSHDAEGRFRLGGEGLPVDRARRRLWGLPVALSLGVPAGTALVADWTSAVGLVQREETRIDWSEAFIAPADGYGADNGTGFQRNMVQFRAEGRWALRVSRPAAIVEVEVGGGS